MKGDLVFCNILPASLTESSRELQDTFSYFDPIAIWTCIWLQN